LKIDEIKTLFQSSSMVFCIAGFGGNTGTTITPIISEIAKEFGLFTISIVTKPFLFEGNKKNNIVKSGIIKLDRSSDSIIIFDNNKLLPLLDENSTLKEAFKMIDVVLVENIIDKIKFYTSICNNYLSRNLEI
jgi:cell division protein FtsZ